MVYFVFPVLLMLTRDSKVACSGHQTKESIIKHSQEYPILINFVKHYDVINRCRVRKWFHHLPSYLGDVKKVDCSTSSMYKSGMTIFHTPVLTKYCTS
jgi:hypothetical protein